MRLVLSGGFGCPGGGCLYRRMSLGERRKTGGSGLLLVVSGAAAGSDCNRHLADCRQIPLGILILVEAELVERDIFAVGNPFRPSVPPTGVTLVERTQAVNDITQMQCNTIGSAIDRATIKQSYE